MIESGEVLVRAENVGKIFCRDLKKSLAYGVLDALRELFPQAHPRARDYPRERPLRSGEFWANHGISFELRRGECLGLIGKNGAGKTTLLKMLNGLIKPDAGMIEIRGRVGAIIALGAGFNPILTGRENVYVYGGLLGLSSEEIDCKIDEIIDFAEIREFIDSPVQSYSSGMQVRLGFSVATAIEPDVLLLDEVLAVGDIAFRTKCLRRIGEISKNSAIIFVSHDQSQVARICDRVLLMERGSPCFLGPASQGIELYNGSNLPSPKGAARVESHPSVKLFRIQSIGMEDSVVSGNFLRIVFEITASECLEVGSGMIHFMDERGICAANSDLSHHLTHLPMGNSRLIIDLQRIDLTGGCYSLNVSMFSANKRSLVLYAIGCGTFRVQGEPFMWSNYRVPVQTVTLLQNSVSS